MIKYTRSKYDQVIVVSRASTIRIAEWAITASPPWQAGAAPVVLVLGGLGFKYVKEALDWTEDPVDAAVDAAVDPA